MRYWVYKKSLPIIHNFLISGDLEMGREFDIYFRATDEYAGCYILEFFNNEAELTFVLSIDSKYYEKDNN